MSRTAENFPPGAAAAGGPLRPRDRSFSLRSRLFVLLALALVSLAAPLILLTGREMTRAIESREEAALANMLGLVEDGIAAKYFALLSGKADRVMDLRKQLRGAALSGRAVWRALDALEGGAKPDFGGRSRLYMEALAALAGTGPALRLYDQRGRLNAAFDGERFFNLAGLEDRKGRPLARLVVQVSLAGEGDFAVFAPAAESGEGGQIILAYFLPLPEHGLVLAAMATLTDIEREAAENLADLLDSTRDRLDQLDFYEHGFLSVLAGGREVLVHRGHPYWAEAALLPAEGLEISKRNDAKVFKFEVPVPAGAPPEIRERGGLIVYIGYFKALDWHIIAAAPKEELAAPARILARRQVAVSVGVTLLILALALIPAVRLVRPLRLLTQKASLLPEMDFTAPETEVLFSRGLPTGRRDEVGGLARSFALMGRALSRNIRELMAATAARERMEGELKAAREIQMGILPPPRSLRLKDAAGRETVALAASLTPAREVGGDLYDFFTTTDGRLALVMGDVSGKGVPAALFMAMTATLVRSALGAGLDPAAAMSRVNEILNANNPRSMFVTLFLALFDPADGVMEFANGGHCPPLIWRSGEPGEDGGFRALSEKSGPVVGVVEGVSYRLFRTRLEPGEMCLMFTDGVTEAQNDQGEFFGQDRLSQLGLDFAQRPEPVGPEDFLRAVEDALLDFQGLALQADDIALLSLLRVSRP
jgi:sigma-B regulation protein RsbU (phosphoserine phosphatase)